jgi:hypothetical protein
MSGIFGDSSTDASERITVGRQADNFARGESIASGGSVVPMDWATGDRPANSPPARGTGCQSG